MPEKLELHFRAHTRLFGKPPREKRDYPQSYVPKWTRGLLLFDCATSTDINQNLLFGTFAQCELNETTGRYDPLECGLFYADGADGHKADPLSKSETKILERFADNSLYRVLPLKKFREEVFLPILAKGLLVTGWNMPFLLSRIASKVNAAQKNSRAFSMYFAARENPTIKTGRQSQCWPGIQVESLGAGQALFQNLKVSLRDKDWQKEVNATKIRPLDLQSLALALTGEVWSGSSAACDVFGLPKIPGVEYENAGRITKPEIEHSLRGLFRQIELLNALKIEFDKHPIVAHPERVISPGSLAKNYYRAANVKPPFCSDKLNGIAQQSTIAGRVEAKVRRVSVPVTYVDFHAQFPAISGLLKCRELATAERLELCRFTKEMREIAAMEPGKLLERCLDPKFWASFLRSFVKVQPEESVLPARCHYSEGEGFDPVIGWERVTSHEPFYVSGPTFVASCLLGKPPAVISAVQVVPKGKQAVRSVMLCGEVQYDPLRDELSERLVELRGKLKKTAPHLAGGTKVACNSAASGLWCELDTTDLKQPKEVLVFSGSKRFRHRESVTQFEKPGNVYCPAISALVFGGSHLLLAMLEKMITDKGGLWLFVDTDGAAIVSTPLGGKIAAPAGPLHSLSWAEVDAIRSRFESLNPRTGTPFLKLEDENFAEDGKTRRQLHGFSVVSKRYALSNISENGDIVVRKASGHVLGNYQAPYSVKEWERRNRKTWKEDLPPWIYEGWRWLLSRELKTGNARAPRWLNQPAVIPYPVSTPAQWRKIGQRLDPFTETVRPMTEAFKFFNPHLGEEQELPISLGLWFTAPSRDLARLYGAQLINARTGERGWLRKSGERSNSELSLSHPCAVTFRSILERHLMAPEPRFNDSLGETCTAHSTGVLYRKHIIAAELRHYLGKEASHRWAYGLPDAIGAEERRVQYEPAGLPEPPKTPAKPHDLIVEARTFPATLLACKAKVNKRTVLRFRRDGNVRPSSRTKVIAALRDLIYRRDLRREAQGRTKKEGSDAIKRLSAKLSLQDGTLPKPGMAA